MIHSVTRRRVAQSALMLCAVLCGLLWAALSAPIGRAQPLPTPAGTPIRPDREARGVLREESGADIYRFEGQRGLIVTIRAESDSFAPALRLFGPDQGFLAGDGNTAPDAGRRAAQIAGFSVPIDGVYSLVVSSAGGIGGYRLLIASGSPAATFTPLPTGTLPVTATLPPTPTPLPTATPFMTAQAGGVFQPLTGGVPAAGALIRADQRDRFAIFAAAESRLSVGAFADADGLSLRVEIYAPNGQLADSATGAAATVLGYRAAVSGAYIVFVSAAGGRGAYTLWANNAPYLREQFGGTLANGIAVSSDLRRGDQATWRVEVPTTAQVEIEIVPEGGPTPTLRILAPDGGEILNTPGFGNFPFTAPRAGIYTLHIAAPEGDSRYSLRFQVVNVAPTATFGPVTRGEEVAIAQGQQYTVSFTAVAGSLITITVTGQADFDPVIELYGPSGQRVARADDVSEADPRAVLQTTASDGDGVYVVRLFGYALMPGTARLEIVTGR